MLCVEHENTNQNPALSVCCLVIELCWSSADLVLISATLNHKALAFSVVIQFVKPLHISKMQSVFHHQPPGFLRHQ